MPPIPPFPWKNSRILVADDEPDMREIFAGWFRNLGCSVTEAADGQEALDALAGEHFDAIVTDVRMPRLSGLQLVQRLNALGRYIPAVIFVSGFSDIALPNAFDLGVEAVLSKPCEKKVLINAVQRCLLRRDLVFCPPDGVAPPLPGDCIRKDFPHSASVAQVAIGRGGFSLNVARRTVADSTVSFSLSFAQGIPSRLEGWGYLRWCESAAEGTRIGIEFFHLEPETLEQFARWLAATRPLSFIPRQVLGHSASSASP